LPCPPHLNLFDYPMIFTSYFLNLESTVAIGIFSSWPWTMSSRSKGS